MWQNRQECQSNLYIEFPFYTDIKKGESTYMRWLINYIRSCFCKHEWECLQKEVKVWDKFNDKYPSHYEWVYRCKKCGCKNVIKNQDIHKSDIKYGEREIMSITITYDSQGRDITCMKEFDTLKYPCRECNREDCEEREEYVREED